MTNGRWNQLAGLAGIAYVLVTAGAGVLPGGRPSPRDDSEVVRDFFVDKQGMLVTQGWLIVLGSVLLTWFALAVRGELRATPAGRHLGEVFFVGTALVAGLSVVAMAIQIVVAKAAPRLSAEPVRVVGFDFVMAQYVLGGFIVATTAAAYAACVITGAMLPRWTGWVAIVVVVLNVGGTFSVFVDDREVSMQGAIAIPWLSTALWYISAALVLLQVKRRRPVSREPGSASAS